MTNSRRAAERQPALTPVLKPPQPDRRAHVTASETRWLLLIHQIPPKPDYLRVKIGRRLARVGAIAIKNSVYALPPTPDAYEDFQWIVREIQEGGGDAFVSEASLVGDGLTDEDIRARFNAARNQDYGAILADARAVFATLRPQKVAPKRSGTDRNQARNSAPQGIEQELAKLRRRFETVNAVDFFSADAGSAVAALLSEIGQTIQRHRGSTAATKSARPIDGATWVTRRDVHVDRIGSAWLIRRFIDHRPRFRFVEPKRYTQLDGELRFDMFEAEYTHVGDACTFETLVNTFAPDDKALRDIAEIVHDVDCKDGKFGRPEAAGLARMIAGVAALYDRDDDRLERGRLLFDDLYAAFGGASRRSAR
jgi:hypothetical protein